MQIELTKGFFASVDSEDFDLAQFNWYALASSHGRAYAARSMGRKNDQLMHRVILERKIGRPLLAEELCDHINGDPLDNRRENLRVASNTQNQHNRKNQHGVSGYKGIYRAKSGLWVARIKTKDRGRIHLGNFLTPEEAAIAYNHAAREHFGEFAYFNDIPKWETTFPIPVVRKVRSDNKSGYTGIWWNNRIKKWQAYIKVAGKQKHLGCFSSIEEALASKLNRMAMEFKSEEER